MRRENPGHSAVLASMVPNAPLPNLSAATEVSSDSIGVHALRGPGEHFHRHAGEPLQQVDTVNGLVDDRAAAVLGDLALPAGVVLGGAIPLHVATREHHAAETSGVDRRLERTRGIAETRLENGADAHARLLGFVQDVIRALDGGVERLLDHQVFAGADRRQRRHEMQRRRRGDAHRVEPGLRQQLIHVIRRETDAVLGREFLGGGARAADDADQPAAAGGGHGARVEMRDRARADETETQSLAHSAFLVR